MTVVTILLVIALILLFMAAVNIFSQLMPAVALGWLGIFFYVLAQFVGGFK